MKIMSSNTSTIRAMVQGMVKSGLHGLVSCFHALDLIFYFGVEFYNSSCKTPSLVSKYLKCSLVVLMGGKNWNLN